MSQKIAVSGAQKPGEPIQPFFEEQVQRLPINFAALKPSLVKLPPEQTAAFWHDKNTVFLPNNISYRRIL